MAIPKTHNLINSCPTLLSGLPTDLSAGRNVRLTRHPVYIRIARLDGEGESVCSHLYCVFKVYPATREFDSKSRGRKGCVYIPATPTALRSALSPLQQTRGPASQCRVHVRASSLRSSANAQASSCTFDVHPRCRVSKRD